MEHTGQSLPISNISKSEDNILHEDIDDTNTVLSLKTMDEEAEILRLESEKLSKPPTENVKKSDDDDEREAKIKFHCTTCGMHEMVHYFGDSPPFSYGIKFLEDTYVMRDPFQPSPPRWKPKAEYFIAMGANCFECAKCVCRECSLFYTHTFCLRCASQQLKTFPVEIQSKIRKQIADKQDY